MYEINFINPNYYFKTSEIFVNDSLFSTYETIRSNPKQFFEFQRLVGHRVQRYFKSINKNNIIINFKDFIPAYQKHIFERKDFLLLFNSHYTYIMKDIPRDIQLRDTHYLSFVFIGNMHKNTILMESKRIPQADEEVIKAFNEAIEFILSLKANTIPIMRTISELATFRGLPPNPEAEESNKRIRGEQTLTNEERLDALQLVSQNQTGFVRLNANDLPIDMLRRIRPQ